MAGPLDVLGRVHDLRANLGRQREFEKVDREETSGTHLEAGDGTLGQDARAPLVGRAVGDDGGLDVADRAVGGGRRAAPQAEVARVVGDERLALRVGPARSRVTDVVAGLCVEGRAVRGEEEVRWSERMRSRSALALLGVAQRSKEGSAPEGLGRRCTG